MLSVSGGGAAPYLLSSGVNSTINYTNPGASLIQSTIPTATNLNSSICSDLNKKIDELIASLQQNECDELAQMKCAINRNTEKLEDLTCAVGGGCNDLKLELIKYEKLYEKVFMAIDTYLEYFRAGDFESLNEELTAEYLQQIGIALATDELYDLECDESLKCYVHDQLMFSKYKSNAHKILDGLNRGIMLHKEIVSKDECCKKADELQDLLNDSDKLTEYIKEKLKEFTLFETNVKSTVMPGLKPQYQRYIEKHGFPENMAFESEKMTEVIKELIEEGIMSETDLDAFLETCNDTNKTNDNICPDNSCLDLDNTCLDNTCNDNTCGLTNTRNILFETSSEDGSEHNIKLEIESMHSNGNTDISGNEGDIDDTFSECTTDSEFDLESIIN